jgi:hypothetical protein
MDQELLQRLELIESMVLYGRRTTQNWGWSFVLWGVGQLIALAWTILWGHPEIAWPVTMTLCGILTGIGSSRMRRAEGAESIISRSLGSIWFSCGVGLFLLGILGNTLGIFTFKSFMVVLFTFMGVANIAAGTILRWRTQQLLGLIWWAVAIVAMFGPDRLVLWLFILMTFAAEVLFGIYLMARGKPGLRHA